LQNIWSDTQGGQCQERYNRELGELYNEPNIVNVLKSTRLRRAGLVRMDKNELPKKDTVDKPWRSMRTWQTEIKMN